MKKICKYLFLIVISVMLKNNNAIAQMNLVPNGSFELQYSCPPGADRVDSCIGWHRVINTPYDFCSPDYLDTCAAYPVSIPDNFCGYQYPFNGHAYMGLYTYHWSYFYREIIGAHFIDTLIPGNTYHVSMRVSRGNWTNQSYLCAASNKLGMRFTTYAYTNVDTPAINNYAQVYTDSIIEDTINWVLLDWNYVPDSFYTHIYIGNFFYDANTDTTIIAAPLGQFGAAYYFIDSVNVVCISSNCFTALNEIKKDVSILFYNAVDKTLYIKGLKEPQCILILYSQTGQEVLRRMVNDNETINVSELSDGFYMAVLRSAHKTAYKKIIKF